MDVLQVQRRESELQPAWPKLRGQIGCESSDSWQVPRQADDGASLDPVLSVSKHEASALLPARLPERGGNRGPWRSGSIDVEKNIDATIKKAVPDAPEGAR